VPRKLGQTKSREQRRQTGHSEQNLRHRSRSPDITIGHCWHHDPTRHRTRSSRPGTSDPRPRSGRQSIPIGHALGNGLVQPIFRPPSRRSPSDCFPSLFPPRRRPKNALRYDGRKLVEDKFVWCVMSYRITSSLKNSSPLLTYAEASSCSVLRTMVLSPG